MTAHAETGRRLLAAACAALLAACGSAPEPEPTHTHRITTTVTVTDEALLPAAAVTIPAFSTVVWRNRTAQDLSIELEAAACPSCETVYGFVAGPNGARAATIGAGAVATLCFHSPGSFPFVARFGSREHRGTVEVGGAP